jgi:hypothetical protein
MYLKIISFLRVINTILKLKLLLQLMIEVNGSLARTVASVRTGKNYGEVLARGYRGNETQ